MLPGKVFDASAHMLFLCDLVSKHQMATFEKESHFKDAFYRCIVLNSHTVIQVDIRIPHPVVFRIRSLREVHVIIE